MKEKDLYPQVKKSLAECGATADKIPGSTYSQGLPDFIGTYKGVGLHLEVKIRKPGKKNWGLTDLQRDHLIRHKKAGASCAVLTYQIPEKIWRLEPTDVEPAPEYRYVQAVVSGHANLEKLLRAWLENRL